jgi:hypothetical protein
MTNDENVKTGDEQIHEATPAEEKDGGGLKIKTDVKAGAGSPIIIDGG